MRKGSKQTPEAIEKNRLAHLGKKDSPETRERKRESHAGEKNAFFGKHHTQETLAKITGRPKSKEHCERLSQVKKGIIPPNIEILKRSRIGATNSDYQKERSRQAITGLVRSDETKQKISENRAGLYCGAENHAWNGGTSFFPYCPKFNERRKKAVRKFFSDLCLTCSKPAAKNLRGDKAVALSVHHVHHNKTEGCQGVPFNLVPLCHDCHNEEQFDQEGYKLRINKILDEGFASGRWSRETYEREVMYPEESNET